MLDSRSRSVHVSDCFDSDKQNIVHFVAYIYMLTSNEDSTNYFQQLTLESWYTNLEQTSLNRCQQLRAPYKRLIHDRNKTDKWTSNRPT